MTKHFFKISTFIYEDKETQIAKQETELKPFNSSLRIQQKQYVKLIGSFIVFIKHIQNKFLYKSFPNPFCMYMSHWN